MMQAALACAACCLLSLVAYRRGSLSQSGACAAVVVGVSIWAGCGVGGFAVLCTFFFTSSALGRVGKAVKGSLHSDYEKGDRRDAFQVFANGGVAAACAVGAALDPFAVAGLEARALSNWFSSQPLTLTQVPWALAAYASLASANADTWATELGVLSRRSPRLLWSGRVVPRGTSGAVSVLGLGVALAGASLIALCAAYATAWPVSAAHVLLSIALAGWTGALLDSALGGLQRQYRCTVCGKQIEARRHCSLLSEPASKPWAVLNNDAVNLLANVSAAILISVLQ